MTVDDGILDRRYLQIQSISLSFLYDVDRACAPPPSLGGPPGRLLPPGRLTRRRCRHHLLGRCLLLRNLPGRRQGCCRRSSRRRRRGRQVPLPVLPACWLRARGGGGGMSILLGKGGPGALSIYNTINRMFMLQHLCGSFLSVNDFLIMQTLLGPMSRKPFALVLSDMGTLCPFLLSKACKGLHTSCKKAKVYRPTCPRTCLCHTSTWDQSFFFARRTISVVRTCPEGGR